MQYITKLKFKSDILNLQKKSSNLNLLFLITFLIYIFFIYIKMSENLSVRYYQGNKKRLKKKLEKFIKIFLKK